jgi:AcrR family transcriptional regulator
MKQRGQAVVDKILDTAERLFYTQGYGNTGINQVIEEADIAKASLYKHFETKTDLLIAYIRRTHERWLNGLVIAIDKVPDPRGKLLAIFDYQMERQKIRQCGGCPFVKANDEAGMDEPRILTEIQSIKRNTKKFIKKLVANSGHKGLLTDQELADTIFFASEGSIVSASVFKQFNDIQTAKKIIQKLI